MPQSTKICVAAPRGAATRTPSVCLVCLLLLLAVTAAAAIGSATSAASLEDGSPPAGRRDGSSAAAFAVSSSTRGSNSVVTTNRLIRRSPKTPSVSEANQPSRRSVEVDPSAATLQQLAAADEQPWLVQEPWQQGSWQRPGSREQHPHEAYVMQPITASSRRNEVPSRRLDGAPSLVQRAGEGGRSEPEVQEEHEMLEVCSCLDGTSGVVGPDNKCYLDDDLNVRCDQATTTTSEASSSTALPVSSTSQEATTVQSSSSSLPIESTTGSAAATTTEFQSSSAALSVSTGGPIDDAEGTAPSSSTMMPSLPGAQPAAAAAPSDGIAGVIMTELELKVKMSAPVVFLTDARAATSVRDIIAEIEGVANSVVEMRYVCNSGCDEEDLNRPLRPLLLPPADTTSTSPSASETSPSPAGTTSTSPEASASGTSPFPAGTTSSPASEAPLNTTQETSTLVPQPPAGPSAAQRVPLNFTIRGLDCIGLFGDGDIVRRLTSALGEGLADETNTALSDASVQLSVGAEDDAVSAQAVIGVPPNMTIDDWIAASPSPELLASGLTVAIKRVEGLETVSTGSVYVDPESIKIQAGLGPALGDAAAGPSITAVAFDYLSLAQALSTDDAVVDVQGNIVVERPANASDGLRIPRGRSVTLMTSRSGETSISGNGLHRLFYNEGRLRIQDIVLRQGRAKAKGGGGGAIWNAGELLLERVTFEENMAFGGLGVSQPILTPEQCASIDTADGLSGGAIVNWASGVVTMRSCSFKGNCAPHGTSVRNAGGVVSMTDVFFGDGVQGKPEVDNTCGARCRGNITMQCDSGRRSSLDQSRVPCQGCEDIGEAPRCKEACATYFCGPGLVRKEETLRSVCPDDVCRSTARSFCCRKAAPKAFPDVVSLVFAPRPLDLQLNMTTGVVLGIRPGPGAAAGVRAGWTMRTLDGLPYSGDLLNDKLNGLANFSITFVKAVMEPVQEQPSTPARGAPASNSSNSSAAAGMPCWLPPEGLPPGMTPQPLPEGLGMVVVKMVLQNLNYSVVASRTILNMAFKIAIAKAIGKNGKVNVSAITVKIFDYDTGVGPSALIDEQGDDFFVEYKRIDFQAADDVGRWREGGRHLLLDTMMQQRGLPSIGVEATVTSPKALATLATLSSSATLPDDVVHEVADVDGIENVQTGPVAVSTLVIDIDKAAMQPGSNPGPPREAPVPAGTIPVYNYTSLKAALAVSGATIDLLSDVELPAANAVGKSSGLRVPRGSRVTIMSSRSGTYISGGDTWQILRNEGTLTIQNITIRDGYSKLGGGGAIYNAGRLAITGCTFSSNAAYRAANSQATEKLSECSKLSPDDSSGGGAIFNDAGGTLSVLESEFEDNCAPHGTSIKNNGGTVVLRDVNFGSSGAFTLQSLEDIDNTCGSKCFGTLSATCGGWTVSMPGSKICTGCFGATPPNCAKDGAATPEASAVDTTSQPSTTAMPEATQPAVTTTAGPAEPTMAPTPMPSPPPTQVPTPGNTTHPPGIQAQAPHSFRREPGGSTSAIIIGAPEAAKRFVQTKPKERLLGKAEAQVGTTGWPLDSDDGYDQALLAVAGTAVARHGAGNATASLLVLQSDIVPEQCVTTSTTACTAPEQDGEKCGDTEDMRCRYDRHGSLVCSNCDGCETKPSGCVEGVNEEGSVCARHGLASEMRCLYNQSGHFLCTNCLDLMGMGRQSTSGEPETQPISDATATNGSGLTATAVSLDARVKKLAELQEQMQYEDGVISLYFRMPLIDNGIHAAVTRLAGPTRETLARRIASVLPAISVEGVKLAGAGDQGRYSIEVLGRAVCVLGPLGPVQDCEKDGEPESGQMDVAMAFELENLDAEKLKGDAALEQAFQGSIINSTVSAGGGALVASDISVNIIDATKAAGASGNDNALLEAAAEKRGGLGGSSATLVQVVVTQKDEENAENVKGKLRDARVAASAAENAKNVDGIKVASTGPVKVGSVSEVTIVSPMATDRFWSESGEVHSSKKKHHKKRHQWLEVLKAFGYLVLACLCSWMLQSCAKTPDFDGGAAALRARPYEKSMLFIRNEASS
eukprot:TRINITY_DN36608_c0_g4_i1.p1 TRINITY_DN36608_c0_g4~~TRINITY_DN36608_c0_g4_i1.p1  ORF type:complete len:2048 (-),score=429.48 TRINITY_DN36608_c0_g4_i1:79-6222(-)